MSVKARLEKLEGAQGDGTPEAVAVCWSDGEPFDRRSAEVLSEARRRGEEVQVIELTWGDE